MILTVVCHRDLSPTLLMTPARNAIKNLRCFVMFAPNQPLWTSWIYRTQPQVTILWSLYDEYHQTSFPCDPHRVCPLADAKPWWRHDTGDGRHGDTLLRPFCVACVEKSEIKRAFGLFFYGDKETGRSQRSEVFWLKSSTLPVSRPSRELSLFKNAKEDTYDMSWPWTCNLEPLY